MARKRTEYPIFEKVEIIDAGSNGKAVAKVDDLVIFIPYVVPGDIVDVKITKKKKAFLEGIAVKTHKNSDKRIEAFCSHFGVCGGCKWQNLNYDDQLFYKRKQVEDSFIRIGKLEFPEIPGVLPSANERYYRNKMEYSFSNKKWLVDTDKIDFPETRNMNALGLHVPLVYDKVLNLDHCYLQKDPSNDIRLKIKQYADDHKLDFYQARGWKGFLRNLVIRTTSTGELMVIMVFHYYDKKDIEGLLDFIYAEFPEITSLMYVVNDKKNDVISDLKAELYKGNSFIIEQMGDLKFKIGPISFFQTNTEQAIELYKLAKDFSEFKGEECVYDLYTGTGTIANFIASSVSKVVGLEYIPEAISDAEENSRLNNISNTVFYAGDIVKTLNPDFVKKNGKPDIIITDPPRAGMHQKVVEQIMEIKPEKIVYISCNPGTQARDIALMKDSYHIEKVQPVDMFPHTHHVENVVLLKLNASISKKDSK